MSLSFYLFFCTYPFFFVLISFLRDSDQPLSFFYFFLLPSTVNSFFLSSRSNHLPPQASSSSFSSHGKIIYPPQAPISTTRTTRIKTHQHLSVRSPLPVFDP